MRVLIQNLSKRFGAVQVLHDISLTIEDRELFFLLGPSGCGKTTLLRLVAGFYQPDAGAIRFGEQSMNGVPPHRRHTGMVFQNYALWPHLTVAENVAYGLEVRAVGGAEKKRRVAEALAIVQMEAYAERNPNQLSGGQQQRVALARALVIKPDVLLLDEPLSNLDAKLRLEMREEIRRIHAQTQITTLYVTHDQKESLSLANRMAVLSGGVLQQVGEPRQVYRSPANRLVADFMGETNWLVASVHSSSHVELILDTPGGLLRAQPQPIFQAGQPVWVGFRPEAVLLGSDPANSFSAEVVHVTCLGEIEQYMLRLSPACQIKALEQNPQEIRHAGQRLAVRVAPESLMVFPR